MNAKIFLVGCVLAFLNTQLFAQGINKLEYFIDNDPGVGLATGVAITPGTSIDQNFTIPLTSLSNGLHFVNIRTRQTGDVWSLTSTQPFYVVTNVAANVQRIEYFIDTDPGVGNATSVAFTPSGNVTSNFAVSLGGVSNGLHILNIRVKAAGGAWSLSQSIPFYVASNASTNVKAMEYFMDTDPGVGNGIQVPITSGINITQAFTVSLASLSGLHIFNVRVKDATGQWSLVNSSVVYVASSSVTNISRLEYFIDTDPGFGNALPVSFTPGPNLNSNFVVNTTALSPGTHVLNVRAKSESGSWSIVNTALFFVARAPSNIALVEYAFDVDPGIGNGIRMNLPVPGLSVDQALSINISALSQGNHKLFIRTRDANSVWSQTEVVSFYACGQVAPIAMPPGSITADSFKSQWHPAPSATTYRLDVSTDNFQTFVGDLNNKQITDTTQVVSSLAASTNYQYRVRAEGVCTSDNSNVITLRTLDLLNLLTDSANLVVLYNETGGATWTNRTQWLSGKVSTWHGITVSGNRVTEISLPNNNITGALPEEIGNLNALTKIDLQNNRVASLPLLTGLTSITSLNVSANQLQFASLEPNIGIPGLNYANQAAVGIDAFTSVVAENNHTLSASVSGANNIYTWKKNNQIIPSATAGTYQITDMDRTKMGVYHAEVTNTVVPGLTIKTGQTTVVGTADISGKLFASENQVATQGSIWLLRVTESGGYDSIADFDIGSSGEYIFEDVVLDDYAIVGIAAKSLYPRAIPTYYKNTIFWEEADTVFLDSTTVNLDILAQLEPEEVPVGNGLIVGVLWEEVEEDGRTKAKRRVSGAGVAARRVATTGRGKEETLTMVDYQITNDQGEFVFEALTEDDYRLNVQYPGYPMDESSDVTISVGSDLESEKRVEANVEDGKIVIRELLITGMEKSENYYAEVFPNPAKQSITIEFASTSDNRYLRLHDAAGHQILEQVAGRKSELIVVEKLPSGFYIISITDKGKLVRTLKMTIR